MSTTLAPDVVASLKRDTDVLFATWRGKFPGLKPDLVERSQAEIALREAGFDSVPGEVVQEVCWIFDEVSEAVALRRIAASQPSNKARRNLYTTLAKTSERLSKQIAYIMSEESGGLGYEIASHLGSFVIPKHLREYSVELFSDIVVAKVRLGLMKEHVDILNRVARDVIRDEAYLRETGHFARSKNYLKDPVLCLAAVYEQLSGKRATAYYDAQVEDRCSPFTVFVLTLFEELCPDADITARVVQSVLDQRRRAARGVESSN